MNRIKILFAAFVVVALLALAVLPGFALEDLPWEELYREKLEEIVIDDLIGVRVTLLDLNFDGILEMYANLDYPYGSVY